VALEPERLGALTPDRSPAVGPGGEARSGRGEIAGGEGDAEDRGVYLWEDADEVVLSLVNYEGPAKVFWEYRSLAGPFWKGNVRNGFALWVAPLWEFGSIAEFGRTLAEVPLSDEVDGSWRRIVFGDVRLEYDLREMRA
jgi:hypothetical protein